MGLEETTLQTYIGVKQIQAQPLTLGEYNEYRGWTIPEDEDPDAPGYLVLYLDGYRSWSPKDVFEKAYFLMGVDVDPTKVNEDMVERFVRDLESVKLGDKTTVVRVVLANDFEIIESSACVDAENYDHNLGRDLAYKRAKDQVWKLLGFLLQSARFGIKR